MEVKIIQVATGSPFLSNIIQMGQAHRRELGFLPVGAFEEAISKGTVLAAVDQSRNCVGYLLYRRVLTKQRSAITHLCVSPEYRGMGIARKLVDELKDATRDLRGVSVFSRRDFDSNSFWPRMGLPPSSIVE